jgi:thiopurine S-methyltransferase
MEHDFWIERWELGETGFHQNEVNPHLIRHWQSLTPVHGSKVFVPLCGKSQDMVWLHKQGHAVIGVELSRIAVEAFFAEFVQAPGIVRGEAFDLYETDGVTIWCGDFFDLEKADLDGVSLVYDRASLIALPPEMRGNYVRHLASILSPETQILLITMDYPQHEMSGPPFAVSAAEVETLYGNYADIRLLSEYDVLVKNPRFQRKGLSRMSENIFQVILR